MQDALCAPLLLQSFEGDTKIWLEEDFKVQVKIVALLHYVDLFPTIDDWHRAFPGAELKTSFFDRWWTLERCDNDIEDVKEIAEDLPRELVCSVPLTGNPHVDKWIADLQRSKA